ncbi:unnamed protein product [Linum tenue]|uniref:Uncharacterized protein n=1 Tax=Linum tenue TaxID=586396 RepID=A0AAV0LC11_9ROSI|nr:unnamed protein product [Linum tenue]
MASSTLPILPYSTIVTNIGKTSKMYKGLLIVLGMPKSCETPMPQM